MTPTHSISVSGNMQDFAQKLQGAAQSGDQNAKEWLLDLKQIALDVKDEQMQVNNLLTALHQFVANAEQQAQQAPPPQQAAYQQPMRGGFGMGGGGMFGGLLGGGFGRAMEMGAGIGLGQDLINSIF